MVGRKEARPFSLSSKFIWVLRGQTVEIRCQLNKEGDYKNTLYTIRWFLYDGTGSLRMENGTVLQPNDRYLLESETFRLYYTSASTDAHKFFAGAKRPKGRAPQASGVRPFLCALITKPPRMNSPLDSFEVVRSRLNDYLTTNFFPPRITMPLVLLSALRPSRV